MDVVRRSCGLRFEGVRAGGKKAYGCSCGHQIVLDRDDDPLCFHDPDAQVAPIGAGPGPSTAPTAAPSPAERRQGNAAEEALARALDLAREGLGSEEEIKRRLEAIPGAPPPEPEPTYVEELLCPRCQEPHYDEGEWLLRPHSTHLCLSCGHEWRPFDRPTYGIRRAVLPQPASNVRLLRGAGTDAAPNEVLVAALQESPQYERVAVVALDRRHGLVSGWSGMTVEELVALARFLSIEADQELLDEHAPEDEG